MYVCMFVPNGLQYYWLDWPEWMATNRKGAIFRPLLNLSVQMIRNLEMYLKNFHSRDITVELKNLLILLTPLKHFFFLTTLSLYNIVV